MTGKAKTVSMETFFDTQTQGVSDECLQSPPCPWCRSDKSTCSSETASSDLRGAAVASAARRLLCGPHDTTTRAQTRDFPQIPLPKLQRCFSRRFPAMRKRAKGHRICSIVVRD